MLVAVGRAAEEDSGAVGKTMAKLEDAITGLWGDGCRLWGCQSVSEVRDHGFEPREPDRASKAAGCVRQRVVNVIRTSTNGTARTTHFVRCPVTRFASGEGYEMGGTAAVTWSK